MESRSFEEEDVGVASSTAHCLSSKTIASIRGIAIAI